MSGKQQVHYVQRGQAQARTAWGWVSEAEQSPFKDRYATLARKLPSYLQVSGLGQTMAFLYAKGKVGKDAKGDKASENQEDSTERAAARKLCEQLGGYLRKQLGKTQTDFMEMIVELSAGEYRRATRELMQIADWVKRFAEGRLGTGSGN